MFNIFYGDLSIQKTEQVLMYELQTMISEIIANTTDLSK